MIWKVGNEVINKFKTLEVEKTVKNIQYYEDDYLSGYHSTIYVDNYKNIIKGEFINRQLTRAHSDITNNGFTKTIRHIEM